MDEDMFYIVQLLKSSKIGDVVIAVATAPKESYKDDIIHISLINKKDDKKILTKNILVMTPREAVLLGVSLIRASLIGEFALDKKEPSFDFATNWQQFFKRPLKETL